MSRKAILELCSPKSLAVFKMLPYWTAEVYGFGKWIREYGHYPKLLPLCIYTDHGPPVLGYPLKQEVDSDAPSLFTHCPSYAKRWKEITGKDCYILYSPFVFCREQRKIDKLVDAMGTIAFPAHTTANTEDQSDTEVYAKQLLKLPAKFQPVSVCLHYSDILKGADKIYRKYKIPVYTAGYYFDDRFSERFYDILKRFKYATSNLVGSYLYYAVEMGIPFSIYGQKHELVNKSDPNLSPGEYDPYKMSSFYRRAFKLFSGLHTNITNQQKNFVEVNLGLRDAVGRSKMREILYKSLFEWTFSLRPIWLLGKVLRKILFAEKS